MISTVKFMKKHRILFTVIAVLLILSIGLVWWQWGNIKALYQAGKYSTEEIESLMADGDRELYEYVEKNPEYNVRPATEAEQELHKKGVLTDDEMTDILTGKTTVKDIIGYEVILDESGRLMLENGEKTTVEKLMEDKETKKSTQSSESALNDSGNTQASNDYNEEISRHIASMYVLKSTYCGILEAMYSEAASEYSALSAEERKSAKASIGQKYMSRALALESECDAKVAGVLASLDSALDKINGDKTIISKIKTAYENEKSLKKAYYLSKI